MHAFFERPTDQGGRRQRRRSHGWARPDSTRPGRTSTDPATPVHLRQSMVIVPLPHPVRPPPRVDARARPPARRARTRPHRARAHARTRGMLPHRERGRGWGGYLVESSRSRK